MRVGRHGGLGRLVVGVMVSVALMAGAAACNDSGTSTTGETDRTVPPDVALVREPPSPPVPGGTLRFGLGAETASGWDPASSQWSSSGTIVSQAIFDPLVTIDEDEVPQPYLAESLTSNEDFTVWDITVRPGISFHNGEPLNAEAVKLNLDRRPTSVLAGEFKNVTSIVVIDDLTIRMTVSVPWSTLPYSLTGQAGSIVAPEQIASDDPKEDPIGTGPFVFQSWERDRKLVVERNPNYWRTDGDGVRLPYLQRIEFNVLAEPTTRGATMDSGGVDIIESFDPGQIQHFTQAAENGQVQMYTNELDQASAQFVGLNTVAPPFDDPLARSLVAAAWDTQRTSDSAYLGIFPKADGMFPSSSPFFSDDLPPGYDPELAHQLSAEYQAKYGQPLRFQLNVPATPEFRAVAELSQENAKQFGIDIEVNLLTEADLIAAAFLGNYQASGLVTFGRPWTDTIFISGTTVAPVGQISLNFTRLADPQIDAALAAARSTSDVAEQAAQWKIVQDRLAVNQNIVWVVRNRSAIIFTNDVFGLDLELPTGQMNRTTTQPFLTETWMAA